jgi:catalase
MESTALSKTPLILRFSTVAGELGAPDAVQRAVSMNHATAIESARHADR